MGRENYTNGGPGTHDEMCLQFVAHYPAAPLLYCMNVAQNGTGEVKFTACLDRRGNQTVARSTLADPYEHLPAPSCPTSTNPSTHGPSSAGFNFTLWLVPALVMLVIPLAVAVGRHVLEKRYRRLQEQQDIESLSEMHSLSNEEEGAETLN